MALQRSTVRVRQRVLLRSTAYGRGEEFSREDRCSRWQSPHRLCLGRGARLCSLRVGLLSRCPSVPVYHRGLHDIAV
jgi:hypothetical protein